MKIEASKPEQVEAWVYGLYGAAQGMYKEYLSEQPIWAFMLAGAIGGVAVSKLLGQAP